MILDAKIVNDDFSSEYSETYHGFHNELGRYESMRFVLRLRPDLHKALKSTGAGIRFAKLSDINFEAFQAFSTYLHETIHWWQHIGSTSGLILSLSSPLQTHINFQDLNLFLNNIGPIKPILKYSEVNSEHGLNTKDDVIINSILNNHHDIEFFKYFVISPEKVEQFSKNPFFESVGHSFHITYSSFISLLASSFDKNLEFLPDTRRWPEHYRKLRDQKAQDYYYGSPIGIPPLGIKEIYEGQARFSQIQYLNLGGDGELTWDNLKECGMLEGVYYKGFDIFINTIDATLPHEVDTSLVGLYLLILDIAINPMTGFPFDIEDFGRFRIHTDPGLRFLSLCETVRDKCPELKSFIKNHSAAEYFHASSELCKHLGFPTPIDGANRICKWADEQEALIELMKEEKTFEFSLENQPIRLIFSRYIRFLQDKAKNPEFFCWPGIYTTGDKCTPNYITLFDEHQALFSDDEDGDIYPKRFKDKDDIRVSQAFDEFYVSIVNYDLVRQWVIETGEFKYDFFWLTSKYSLEDGKKWAISNFENMIGISPESFEIL
ncbi:MAG: hypothetical protein ACI9SP_003261 [Arenicella sp.]|jgi:hypothetical protein